MLPPGHVIDGRYEILGPLGAGGMGQIYRARRVKLGDEVALKALLSYVVFIGVLLFRPRGLFAK